MKLINAECHWQLTSPYADPVQNAHLLKGACTRSSFANIDCPLFPEWARSDGGGRLVASRLDSEY
jgi:hypothetical protein